MLTESGNDPWTERLNTLTTGNCWLLKFMVSYTMLGTAAAMTSFCL